ncbi:MAG: PHP domain-containing protein [Syntrophomonadaceae bacterium]
MFLGDYHTHSHYSDGRQTEKEIVAAARAKGLKEIAITDHGPLAAVIGVNSIQDFRKMRQKLKDLQENNEDLLILLGAEANIRDAEGNLDIPPEVVEELDILIAGLHPYTLPGSVKDGWEIFGQNSLRHFSGKWRNKAIKANTRACVQAIKNNPRLDILSHPGLFFQVDIEEVADACVKYGVMFEINCAHEYPPISDIMKADRLGVDFIINSDAHFPSSVGNLEYGKRIMEKLKIDPQKVANLRGRGGFKEWKKKMKTCIY